MGDDIPLGNVNVTSHFEVIKSVIPKGKILNDNGTNVDHLGHVVYAEALGRQIQTINTPVTVGIFSKWGSGKSFLLKHVQSLLRLKQKQDESHKPKGKSTRNFSNICTIVTFFIFVSLIVIFSTLAIFYHSTFHFATTSTIFLILLLFLLLLLYTIVQVSGRNCFSDRSFSYKWTLFYALFTILPIRNVEHHNVYVTPHNKIKLEANRNSEPGSNLENLSGSYPSSFAGEKSTKTQRYIFVNFNAWEYIGTDVLWAGIVTNLADRIEREFGTFTSRIFRTISLETTTHYQPIVKSKHTELLVKIPSTICNNDAEIVSKIMSDNGVVINCQKYTEWKKNKKNSSKITELVNDKENWWVVTFENQQEAKSALITMKHYCIESKLACKEEDRKPRTENNDKQPKSFCKMFEKFWTYFKKQPKRTCRFANLYWVFLFIFAVITIPIVSCLVIFHFELFKISDASSIVIQVLSWSPSVGSLLYVIVSTVWALVHSQHSRVVKAVEGIQNNLGSELGFMHKVKREVEAITDLVHAVEFIYNIRYKVVIMIDDLDRIPLPKVRRVLESVNILLSERNSPFVCLIAVDSRIAVKCFQEASDSGYISNINGYEYLKKIINLPFCIPEVNCDNRSRYIAGLIDEADHTEDKYKFEKKRKEAKKLNAEQPLAQDFPDSTAFDDERETRNESAFGDRFERSGLRRANGNNKDTNNLTSQMSVADNPIDFDSFLFQCRNFLFDNKHVGKHIYGNPRNIKRIFNVISVTTSVIRCHQDRKKINDFLTISSGNNEAINASLPQSADLTDENKKYIESQHKRLAEDIVLWIILSDQWPFRVSYILEAMQDADQRADAGRKEEAIDDSKSLLCIYKKVSSEIACCEVDNHHFTLDVDSDIFYSFLKLLEVENRLNKGRVKELLKYSVNLDHSIRQTISYLRNKTDLSVNLQASVSRQEKRFVTEVDVTGSQKNGRKKIIKHVSQQSQSVVRCFKCTNDRSNCRCIDEWTRQIQPLISNMEAFFQSEQEHLHCSLCSRYKSECSCRLEVEDLRRLISVHSVRQEHHFVCFICNQIRSNCNCKDIMTRLNANNHKIEQIIYLRERKHIIEERISPTEAPSTSVEVYPPPSILTPPPSPQRSPQRSPSRSPTKSPDYFSNDECDSLPFPVASTAEVLPPVTFPSRVPAGSLLGKLNNGTIS